MCSDQKLAAPIQHAQVGVGDERRQQYGVLMLVTRSKVDGLMRTKILTTNRRTIGRTNGRTKLSLGNQEAAAYGSAALLQMVLVTISTYASDHDCLKDYRNWKNALFPSSFSIHLVKEPITTRLKHIRNTQTPTYF